MEKTLYTLIAASLLTITFSSCNSVDTITKLEYKKYSPKNNLTEYKDRWEALENFDFNYLKQDSSGKYKIAANIFELINTNKYDEAITVIKSEIKNESDEEFHKMYLSLLYQMYFTNYMWKDILEFKTQALTALHI